MFKYSLNLEGSKENKERFVREIQNLGYKAYGGIFNLIHTLCLNNSNATSLPNGSYWTAKLAVKRDYNFNIDTEEGYNTALAIAAIHDNNLPHIGEMVAAGLGRSKYTILGEKGSLHRIHAISEDKKVFDVDDYTRDDHRVTDLGYDRKATPEEIINFYNNKTEKKMSDASKTLVGFRAKSAIGDIAAGQVVYISPLYTMDRAFPYFDKTYSRQVTGISIGECKRYPEFWFPVYEDPKPTVVEVKLNDGDSVGEVIYVKKGNRLLSTSSGRGITIDKARRILEKFGEAEESGHYSVTVCLIQIGCVDEGINCSIDDVREVVKAWETLNA